MGPSVEEIRDALYGYRDQGVVQVVLTTDPLGEEWVLVQEGRLLKLVGDEQALAWLAGAGAVARTLAARAGLSL